jgi:hypothetical protein
MGSLDSCVVAAWVGSVWQAVRFPTRTLEPAMCRKRIKRRRGRPSQKPLLPLGARPSEDISPGCAPASLQARKHDAEDVGCAPRAARRSLTPSEVRPLSQAENKNAQMTGQRSLESWFLTPAFPSFFSSHLRPSTCQPAQIVLCCAVLQKVLETIECFEILCFSLSGPCAFF